MSANTIITSVVTAGTNNHTTVAEEANTIATDFVTQGVVGAITLNSGSGGTGSFCVNQNTGSNMAINILAGQAYVTATPSSQDSQVLRARAASSYAAYTINSNSSGSTKFDYIYLQVDATKANNPAADASDVTSIFTSRSSLNTTDNGTPPTYGLLLAVVTVANGATAINNGNITDKRFNTSIGAQNGSLVVTQNGTGTDAIVQAAGIDSNVSLNLEAKGTASVKMTVNGVNQLGASVSFTPIFTNWAIGTGGSAGTSGVYTQIGKRVFFRIATTLGSSGESVGTGVSFLLPVISSSAAYILGAPIGLCRIRAAATGFLGYVRWNSTTSADIITFQTTGSFTNEIALGASTPATFTAGDALYIEGEYEAS